MRPQDQSNTANDNQSSQRLSQFMYTRKMGAFRPRFQGVPESYYPLSWKQIIKAVLILLLVIAAGLGIMIGFLFWVQSGGLEKYVIVWVAVLLGLLAAFIVAFYFSGKQRRKEEKLLIAESNRRNQEILKNKIK